MSGSGSTGTYATSGTGTREPLVEQPPTATANAARKPPVVVQAEPYNPPPPPTYQREDPYEREPYGSSYGNRYGRERVVITDRYGRRYLVERDAYYEPQEPSAEEEWMWACCVCIYCFFIILLFMLMFGALGQPGQQFKTACKDMFVGAWGNISSAMKSLGQSMNFHVEEVGNLLKSNNLRSSLDKSFQNVNINVTKN